MGMRIAENGTFYILTVFVLTYGEEALGLGKNTMLTGVMIAAALGLFTIPFYGWLSDRVGRKEALHGRSRVLARLRVPVLHARGHEGAGASIWLAIVLGVNVGHDLMYGPQAAYFSELFGTRVRYTGASVGYQLASVFAGGFAPLIAVALLAAADDEPTYVALYMAVMALITVIATYFARETYRQDLGEATPRPPTGASCASRPPTARQSRARGEQRDRLHPRGDADQVRAGRLGRRRLGAEAPRRLEAMVVSDPGIVEAGITGRVVEAIEAAGIEAVVFDRARVEPTAESLQEAADFAVDGDFDGFVGVGGGSSLDTAKVADLVATHPAPIMDYVNPPVGGARSRRAR